MDIEFVSDPLLNKAIEYYINEDGPFPVDLEMELNDNGIDPDELREEFEEDEFLSEWVRWFE